ncbi:MAG: class F sortase [Patescibacteria group bacterium]
MKLSSQNVLALFVVLLAAGIFLFTLLHSAVFVASSDDVDAGIVPIEVATSSGRVSSSSSEAGVPAKIRIPNIDVDANVVDVGLGKTGNMAVPLAYSDVGWYRYGPRPGEVGSSVIDGHVDNGFALPAVFARLKELKEGDDIYIDTKDGATLHFVVESAETYDVAHVPRERLFNQGDTARLNLVTCEGEWLADQKMYDERHIVYAVLES